MNNDDIAFLELHVLTEKLRNRELSPVDVLQEHINRIRNLDGALHSLQTLLEKEALEQARVIEKEIARGDMKGPLHGAILGIKDLLWVKGVPTTAGMPLHKDFRPTEDATVVRKLKDAGAIILAMTRMTEGAYSDHHPDVVAPINPWHPDYWTGASSSGSGVATAAGFVHGSIGSDTGGSIRLPCAANGLTGVKPTWGRVSRYGIYDAAASLDCLGPMTRSAKDAAAMLGAIAGRDDKDPTASLLPVPDYFNGLSCDLQPVRLGIDWSWIETVSDDATHDVIMQASETLRGLGVQITSCTAPDATSVIRNWVAMCSVGSAVAHAETYPLHREKYGPTLAGLLDLGSRQTACDYERMSDARLHYAGRLRMLFEDIDILIVPVTGIAAPTLEKMSALASGHELNIDMLTFTAPFNMSGNPTVTLPGGMTKAGVPIGFQLVGNHFSEGLLLAVAHAYQLATRWHTRHPSLGV